MKNSKLKLTKRQIKDELAFFRREYKQFMIYIDKITIDAVKTMGYKKDDDIAIDYVMEYLAGHRKLSEVKKLIEDSK
jgi:phenylacetate-coenzyme A ligase PaaK-like adenylate-forming protein